MLAAERYDGAEPVNLGAGCEISIRDLVELIAELTGFQGRDRLGRRPSPTASRAAASTPRAPSASFGFRARTPFEEGLRRTIDWYREARR